MSEPLDRVLPLLEAVKRVGSGSYEARCPAHDDTEPSLTLAVADGGHLLLHCHGGCTPEAVTNALGLTMRDLFPSPRLNGKARPSRMEYAIKGLDGGLIATHVRLDLAGGKKKMWWERNGRRTLGDLRLEDLPLYGIDRLDGVEAGTTVIVVEGEKAAESLIVYGIRAVGTVTGASSQPGREALRPLLLFDVALWPDNDPPGRAHMERVAATLTGLGGSPRMMTWLSAPVKGDAADFFEAGLGRDELNAMYSSAATWTPSNEAEAPSQLEEELLHLTDMGNARRLVARHGRDLRWCREWRRWLVWNGARWDGDDSTAIQAKCKETAQSIWDEAIATQSDDRAEALFKHAARSESSGKIVSMAELAVSEPDIAIATSALDADTMLFNCQNGTYNLAKGEFREHSRGDLITKISPVEYAPAAACPRWERFLARIFSDDAEIISFVQRAAGYSLTGSIVERVMLILHGVGHNGKTTLIEVLAHVLGDYAMSTPVETLLARKDKGIPNDVARLQAARFVSATESEHGDVLAEGTIKAFTGGDRVTARFLHAEWFTFTPQLKLWLATNHRPQISGTDRAIWDRIRLIPFLVEIPESERIKGLKDRMIEAEASGILNWVIAGCQAWQEHGLEEPESIRRATDEYRANEDTLGAFVEDCTFIEADAWVSHEDLYAAYIGWCKRVGEEQLGTKTFSQRLCERQGISRKRDPAPYSRVRGYGGVRLPEKPKPVTHGNDD